MTEPGDALVLTIPCELCGAAEYVRCVYVWPKGVAPCEFEPDSDRCFRHSDTQHRRLAQVGTPTKVPHQVRKNAVFNRRVRERQLIQYERLRQWFADYGDIFSLPEK